MVQTTNVISYQIIMFLSPADNDKQITNTKIITINIFYKYLSLSIFKTDKVKKMLFTIPID